MGDAGDVGDVSLRSRQISSDLGSDVSSYAGKYHLYCTVNREVYEELVGDAAYRRANTQHSPWLEECADDRVVGQRRCHGLPLPLSQLGLEGWSVREREMQEQVRF